MIKEALLHTPHSEWVFHPTVYKSVIRFRTAKNDALNVALAVRPKYINEQPKLYVMERRFSDSLYDYYETEIPTHYGRIYYYFVLTDKDGKEYFYTEHGFQESEEDTASQYYPYFMIPYITAKDTVSVPDKFKNSVIYQIFPDRFYASNPKISDWVEHKPVWTDYYGGDLYGIYDKLNYLKDLGIDVIYLTPIFVSGTSHHYDVRDYYKVSDDFGGDEAFRKVVEKAHTLGIKILLDGVFNHCSSDNPIFQDVIRNGQKSEYYDWFYMDEPERGSITYETYADRLGYMPKLRSDNEEVIKFVSDVTTYWIKNFGVDGWRLDVADDVSPYLWREVRKAVKAIDSQAIIIGEDWRDSRLFLQGDCFDGVMNFLFNRVLRDYIAFGKINGEQAADRLIRLYFSNNASCSKMMMNVLDCHDTPRFFTLCKENIALYHMALCLLFFYDGMPLVYYGDELPMSGATDPDCRRGFDWRKMGSETSSLIRLLNEMRRSESEDTKMYISSEKGVLILERKSSRVNYLCINLEKECANTKYGKINGKSAVISINGKVVSIQ